MLRSVITACKRLHQLDHLAVSERNSVMGSGVAQVWVQVIEFLTTRYLFLHGRFLFLECYCLKLQISNVQFLCSAIVKLMEVNQVFVALRNISLPTYTLLFVFLLLSLSLSQVAYAMSHSGAWTVRLHDIHFEAALLTASSARCHYHFARIYAFA